MEYHDTFPEITTLSSFIKYADVQDSQKSRKSPVVALAGQARGLGRKLGNIPSSVINHDQCKGESGSASADPSLLFCQKKTHTIFPPNVHLFLSHEMWSC
jgi:hypothetical protein